MQTLRKSLSDAPPPADSETPSAAARTARNGDALSFDGVYTDHFDFVCRSLRLLGVSAEALEDAAQDVFGIVLRRLGEFVPTASIKTWLFAIVQRVASNQRRRRRRKEARHEPLRDSLASEAATPEAHARAAEAAALIQTFAEQLDDGHRAVLVLAMLEHVAVREVAESLGVPLYTVYSRIRSIRRSLEAFLREHGVET